MNWVQLKFNQKIFYFAGSRNQHCCNSCANCSWVRIYFVPKWWIFYGHHNKLDRAYKNIFERKRVNSAWCRVVMTMSEQIIVMCRYFHVMVSHTIWILNAKRQCIFFYYWTMKCLEPWSSYTRFTYLSGCIIIANEILKFRQEQLQSTQYWINHEDELVIQI